MLVVPQLCGGASVASLYLTQCGQSAPPKLSATHSILPSTRDYLGHKPIAKAGDLNKQPIYPSSA